MSELLCEVWWNALDAVVAPDVSIAARLAQVRKAISVTASSKAPEGKWSANTGCHQYNSQLKRHCNGLVDFQLTTGSIRGAYKEIDSLHYFLTDAGDNVHAHNEIVVDTSWMQYIVADSFDINTSIFVGSREQLMYVFRKHADSINRDRVKTYAQTAGIDDVQDISIEDFVKAMYLFDVKGARRIAFT